MKRIVPFILLFVALLLHGTEIQAQNHGVLETVVPIEGIMFNNLGVTTNERLPSGKTKVTTVGMKGYGHVACDGKLDCIATGLDWKQIDIRLDLQLLLSKDPDNPFKNARGRVRGEVGIPLPSGDTRTFGFTAKRLVIAAGVTDSPALFLEMRIEAQLGGRGKRPLRARLEQILTGEMEQIEPGGEWRWRVLGGAARVTTLTNGN